MLFPLRLQTNRVMDVAIDGWDFVMFKLTALLCAAMYCVFLVAGEDRGQLRPGLALAASVARAAPETTEPMVVIAAAPEAPTAVVVTPEVVAQPASAPADVAPVSTPVTVAAATSPATEQAIEDTVFSLANYADNTTTPLAEPAAQSPAGLAFVDAESVNVRQGPGTDNPVLTRLSRGEAVTIVSTDQTGWAYIRIEGDGIEGFMSLDYLAVPAP
jgi:Bacterial SH3 domain